MNVLFLTIAYPKTGQRNIYVDLMQEFAENGHSVYIACSSERRDGRQTTITKEDGKTVLRVKIGNITGQVNLIEKGLTTLSIEHIFLSAIRKFFKGVKFDLIIYSTPPITFSRVIKKIKDRDKAITYLLLKDIFPQNAVDIGIIKKGSQLHRFFRKKEQRLYALSDYIGCMSQANIEFLLKNNPGMSTNKVEICPNSIKPKFEARNDNSQIRKKYGIPDNCRVFIYGGNLGKPQGISFVNECLKTIVNLKDRFFIICGSGTEYVQVQKFYQDVKPKNMLLINGLPKQEYDELLTICDVGLIFLDHRFTIPNFPSRLLSYMDYSIPVLACTDINTDLGKVIIDGQFGWWCESNDSGRFKEIIDLICFTSDKELSQLGNNARRYLEENYTAKISYEVINKNFE